MTTYAAPLMSDFVSFVHNAEVRATVRDLLAARETFPKIEAHVAEILAPVFARFEFWSAGFRGKPPERITDERMLYLAGPKAFDSPEMHAWDVARHEALVAAGHDLPGFGYCPAAIARCKVSELETALVEHAARLLHPAFANAATKTIEEYQATLDLLINAVVDLNK